MNKATRKAVIAGNWKMNKTPAEAKVLLEEVIPAVKDADCEVIACVPYVDLYVGRRVIEIILAIYKSQKTGLPVKFPLKEFASAEMTGEFDR